MNEEYTVTRIRKDVLRRLKVIADREKRTVPNQIAWLVEREESATTKEPAGQATPEPQEN